MRVTFIAIFAASIFGTGVLSRTTAKPSRARIIPATCPNLGTLSDWPSCPPPTASGSTLASFSFANDCCYKQITQICSCKAVEDWCRFHFSDCCGPVKMCAEQCVCIPPELVCRIGDGREVCESPYGEDEQNNKGFSGFKIPIECPVC